MELAVQRSLNCRTPVDGSRTPIPRLEILDSRSQDDFPQIDNFEEESEDFTTETKEHYSQVEVKDEPGNDTMSDIKNANDLLHQRHSLPSEWVSYARMFNNYKTIFRYTSET